MCKVGDIILVKSYISQGKEIDKHSFVVLNVEHGKIEGLDYNLMCNVMSSFSSPQQRLKKLEYPGNFEITHNDSNVLNGNTKDGYIKAEQFYYFDRKKLDFEVIGNLDTTFFEKLIKFIHSLDEYEHIIDNL